MSDVARPPAAPADPSAFWRWVWAAVRPVLGWVLVGAGALLITLGWFGVSRTVLPAKQLPYLLSGGLGGLAVVVVGAVLLAGQDVRRELTRLDRVEARLDELVGLLTEAVPGPAAGSVSGPDSRADRPTPAAGEEAGAADGAPSPVPASPTLVTSRRGRSLHRADCPLVAGKPDLSPAAAEQAHGGGLRTCRVCEPLPSGTASA